MLDQARIIMRRAINGLILLIVLLGAIAVIRQGDRPASTVRTIVPRPVTVTTITGAPTLKEAIAAQKGKVVVVNFWATYCGPCVAEFPDLVKLQNDKPGKVTVMAVSQDTVKDLPAKVTPFLTKQQAYFPQFLLHTHDTDGFINAIDPKWAGDLPRTFVYDRRGHLAKILSGPQTEATFDAAVEPLIERN
jgi:thiol-disulfide isomerase/thioredoxin